MLNKVSVSAQDIDKYRVIETRGILDELVSLAKELKGVSICHVSSTPFGGGVAELLISYIPLLRGLGIKADWQIIRGNNHFFTITKGLHNALQGASFEQINDTKVQREYLSHNLANARELDKNYDVLVINDPQPAALRHFSPESKAKWIWRSHVDSSKPDKAVWDFLRPYVENHDAAIFTADMFIPQELNIGQVATMAPAINPLSSKNFYIDRDVSRELLESLGIDPQRHLITQVSRFDQWKDPFGTIAAYRLAKARIPGLQLAMVGSFAPDDPESWDMHAAIHEVASDDDDLFIFSNLTGVGNMEVNAFQRASEVILQKSIREGFGLVVSEALWKGTPVVAGDVGGIPMQMPGELGEYLVSSIEEAADKIVYLIKNPDVRERLGHLGQQVVTENFLMPRLARDELNLVKNLLS